MSGFEETRVGGVDALVISSEHLSATVLAGKGADLLSLVNLSTGVDPLWKSRWGASASFARRTFDSTLEAWFAQCQGGWQLLAPSGGDESRVGDVVHPQHGEACSANYGLTDSSNEPSSVRVELETSLCQTPLKVIRRFELDNDLPIIRVDCELTNEGGETTQFMVAEHPTLGQPFLSPRSSIHTNATTVETDSSFEVPHSPYAPNLKFDWPGEAVDLAAIPEPEEPRQLLAYLSGFDDVAWYCVRSPDTDCFFGMAWRRQLFPCAWFFEEFNGSSNYPWFSNSYLAAIEPATCAPGWGLGEAIKRGVASTLDPGASWTSSVYACVAELGEEVQVMSELRAKAKKGYGSAHAR